MTTEHLVGLTYADRLRLVTEARHEGLRQLFASELCALTSLMGPMSEGPEWPAGAAWLATRHGHNACIISDGLSDPWVERDRPETGLGLEVFIESPDAGVNADSPLKQLADTWLFPMVAEISHSLANYQRLSERLLAGELVSMEFNIDHLKDGRGRVGVLLQTPQWPSHHIPIANANVAIFAATLLTPAELKFLRGKGEAGRQELAQLLHNAGFGHISYKHRPSVV